MRKRYILLLLALTFQNMNKKDYLKVLKKHRDAIGYTLDDLKGISPTLYPHKINMEPDAKPVVDHQRCLNPKNERSGKNINTEASGSR